MILGSHNSWSYLPVRRWWMKPIAFMAKCQRKTIREQYDLGVRCFDLRLYFDDKLLGAGSCRQVMYVAHGIFLYKISGEELREHLRWLDERGDCYVRILHEARTKRQYTKPCVCAFRMMCSFYRYEYPNIRFWCGRNLYDWTVDYDFCSDPSCEERYGSVSDRKWLYVWWPWIYARLQNKKILEHGTDKDILLVDFIDINNLNFSKQK